MLSRLAESSFWLGRYLERAEGMSRLLVEFHQLLIQDQRAHVKRGCALIGHGLGLEGEPKSARELVSLAYGEPLNPGTLLGSIHSARSNARLIRDILPSDFYQAINQLNATTGEITVAAPGRSLRTILDRLAVSNGIFEWLAPEDESAHFLTLGRSLERMDLMSRLLSLKLENEWRDQGPATTLRSVGALTTYLRARVPLTSLGVRKFLVESDNFPRSIAECAKRADVELREIGAMTQLRIDDILRPIGMLESQIKYLNDDYEELERIITQTSKAVAQATDGIGLRFFRPVGSIVWSN
jgi:uncharacterized alpha-E superfamily protein